MTNSRGFNFEVRESFGGFYEIQRIGTWCDSPAMETETHGLFLWQEAPLFRDRDEAVGYMERNIERLM